MNTQTMQLYVNLVETGAVDPEKILTQREEPLTSAIEAYKAFDKRQPSWIEVKLDPAK